MSTEPYDPYIPEGQRPQGKNVINDIKDTIEATRGDLAKNVIGIQQRGANLQELESQTNRLEESAHIFNRTSRRAHMRERWRHQKMKILVAIGIIVLLAIIIIPAVVVTRK